MYPYIGSIPLLGVGIIVTLLVFIGVFYRQAKQHSLGTTVFFRHLGYYIAGIFLLSTYSYYLFEEFIFFPLHWKQVLLYVSPFEFRMHSVGTIFALLITGIIRYKKYSKQGQGQLFLRVFFDAFMISATVFGLFLVLSDNFFGIGSSFLVLQPLTIHSIWAAYDSTMALGILVSLLSMLCYVVLIWQRHRQYKAFASHTQPIELIGWAVWSLGMLLITLQQHYPRHLVTSIFDTSFDIKQYLYAFIACFFIVVFLQQSSFKHH